MNRTTNITFSRAELATLYFAIKDKKEDLASNNIIDDIPHYEHLENKLNALIAYSEVIPKFARNNKEQDK